MDETSKSIPLMEASGYFRMQLCGQGIDVGCGPDVLRVPDGTVRPWDVRDGDATYLASIPTGSMDFLYSSHCLEHLADISKALYNWARVLRRGGYAHIVVPDYVLYEHLRWPSRYNGDHKHSFSMHLERERVGRSNHWNIARDLGEAGAKVGLTLIEARVEDAGFNYNAGDVDQTMGVALAQIRTVWIRGVAS